MIKKSIPILIFVLSASLLKAQIVYEIGFTMRGNMLTQFIRIPLTT